LHLPVEKNKKTKLSESLGHIETFKDVKTERSFASKSIKKEMAN
jgi:hypothetical protein